MAQNIRLPVPIPIRDQRGLNSCVAMSLVDAAVCAMAQMERPAFTGAASALFVHYNARHALGQANHNFGVPPKDAIAAMSTFGLCPEPLCPDTLADFRARPDQQAYTAAKTCRDWSCDSLSQDMGTLQKTLKGGQPFMACLRLTGPQRRAFFEGETRETGHVITPQSSDQFAYNHAMLCIGYTPATDCYYFRNSMGEAWGDAGYAHVPSSILCSQKLAYGFYKISTQAA